ncbi:MAG: 16S rRNA (cytidine(1402)-2'-O)-methyltransferase [Dehalococcoidales bacterium]|jgi:16S rRNA (cytidine1402-2'-O)-methyltransferase|nr:16S rRNA (cytidine(1402)-2'-O)-methyltransferase [Dehalococcoidales bacterium]MDP6222147.1 16S rRNA (cytidine(1402)-2'-O)-methyltransferase [Dehalococcoidales bacterium]MDP7109511.1 16S rRNA (cytidine(1402)-2'-O)-methyltransferase [Dehalococcoidales bacterium]MDP7310010.1 16S rRNA (cytidine(1402)-2'-O)-methyltransferase [Dehalococcoidales bacterium]MDP7410029.1 16S rRNA (cytidine(1402)-2'-O)-methyltransferase [Dehalococcoidales bacterium]
MPTLYIVATPIGNLSDITWRALETLRTVELIAAEDTRKTRRLLTTYKIKTPMTSYHEHNKRAKLDYLLNFLEQGDVALVSEAGTPGISDPGYELVAAVGQRGIPIVPIPGPSVVVAALAVSGLPTDRFIYLGFLPRRVNERRRLLRTMINEPATVIALEAPHRLRAALNDLLLVVGDRRIAVCRELTKIHEEVFRGTISQASEYFVEPRGEFTLVIEGQREERKPQLTPDIERWLRQMRLSGVAAKETITTVSCQTGLSKKELYRAWLRPA